MSNLLQPNQIVDSHSGEKCRVLNFIGSGGQGEVYRAEWGGVDFALKWYYEQSATADQRSAIEALINLPGGRPSDKFLWPEDLATAKGVPGFGYIMRLREKRFRSLTDLVAGKIDRTFLALITAGLELSKAFRSLHTKGLCYRDISFGNAFFDPVTGDVVVCDNDNVATNGSAQSGVNGTPGFRAPEIVRNEAIPSTSTDMHSLAVLLFYMFHIHHPLEGKKMLQIRCLDLAALERIHGKEPVFIFDPADDSNAAVADDKEDPNGHAGKNAIAYWNLYPRFMRNRFIKAFTKGLHDPDARVTELEWMDTLAALRNSLFRCSCGTPNFFDQEALKETGLGSPRCWSCRKQPQPPFRLHLGRMVVLLNADSKLFPHHTAEGHSYDFGKPVAEVVQHPKDPNIWGLRNLTAEKWIATIGGAPGKEVSPGRSVPLAPGTKVQFGSVEGEIRY